MYAALIAATLALLADAPAAQPPSHAPAPPGAAFLTAADANDRAAMAALLDPGSAAFLKKIDGCYLRRVYDSEQAHEVIGAWMCALPSNRSRVVLAGVSQTPAGKVAIAIQLDQTNNRPAPERTGSAFAK